MSAFDVRDLTLGGEGEVVNLAVQVGERLMLRGDRETLALLFDVLAGRTDLGEAEVTVLGSPHPGPAIRTRRWAQRVALARGELHLVENIDLLRNLTVPMVFALGISERRARELAAERLEGLGLGDRARARPAQVEQPIRQLVHLARATTPARDLAILLDPQRGLPTAEAAGWISDVVSGCRTTVILCSEHWMEAPEGFQVRTLGDAA